MPSPFRGMDPYLEHRRFFPDLYGGLDFAIKDDLQPILCQSGSIGSGFCLIRE
jgi:hypothetical protein